MKERLYKLIPYLFIILGLTLGIIYNIKGSYVDENGFLIEPFYLIPLSIIFIFIGISFLGYQIFKKLIIFLLKNK
ncbi:MAG TPA: hypothetical protein DCL21_04670 [Alphaproteobacteria bacterium]|nr:hypothetical protein [Alphaproteobacteria bacterium]